MAAKLVTLLSYLPWKDEPLEDEVTLAKARMYVSMCLVDNQITDRKSADRFAHEVTRAPKGTRVEHPSGLAFEINWLEAVMHELVAHLDLARYVVVSDLAGWHVYDTVLNDTVGDPFPFKLGAEAAAAGVAERLNKELPE